MIPLPRIGSVGEARSFAHDVFGDDGDLLGTLGLGDDPVPAQDTPHGALVRPGPHDPDGDARSLDRDRTERHRPEPVVAALEGEGLAGPEPLEDGQRLVHQLGARPGIGRLAHVAEPGIVERAQPDREDESTARQVIDRHGLARQLPGSAP